VKTLVITALAAITGYAAAGEPSSSLSVAFNDLKNLTLVSVAEREMRCAKSKDELGCREAFSAFIDRTFDSEAKVFEALTAEQAGDIARRDAIIAQMRQAAEDGRKELERLKSLHVP
jgi:hypothetical protein